MLPIKVTHQGQTNQYNSVTEFLSIDDWSDLQEMAIDFKTKEMGGFVQITEDGDILIGDPMKYSQIAIIRASRVGFSERIRLANILALLWNDADCDAQSFIYSTVEAYNQLLSLN